MHETELEYIERRKGEVLAQAAAATDPVAARLHRQLAGLFAHRAREWAASAEALLCPEQDNSPFGDTPPRGAAR